MTVWSGPATQWTESTRYAVWVIGMSALVFGLAVERLAVRRGWRHVARIVPALVIAFVLTGLIAAERSGAIQGPVKQAIYDYTKDCPNGWLRYLSPCIPWRELGGDLWNWIWKVI